MKTLSTKVATIHSDRSSTRNPLKEEVHCNFGKEKKICFTHLGYLLHAKKA